MQVHAGSSPVIRTNYGGVSERFKELVLKTSDRVTYQGFESLPLRHTLSFLFHIVLLCQHTEKYSSGDEAPLLRE